MSHLLSNILQEKCPFCGKGDVYQKGKLLEVPKMSPRCPACHRDFTGEPGYYFGAMYVSYGIGIALGIMTFLVCRFLLGIQSLYFTIGIIAFFIILISYKNYKWSRIIWLKLFPPGENTNYEKQK